MASFALTIQAEVKAQNIASANKKADALTEYLRKQGWELPEVRVKGQGS